MRSPFGRKTAVPALSLLLLLTAPSVWLSYVYREHRDLHYTSPSSAGSFVALPGGITHYELRGPEQGNVVVMLHGSSIASWDFDLQMNPLISAGYRVLRYDAFGRGLSERPKTPIDREMLRRQWLDLLRVLDIQTPVMLVGHSLGGALAVDVAAEDPGKVRAVVLVAPVVNRVSSNAPFVICRAPLVSAFLARVALMPALRRRNLAQWQVAAGGVDLKHYDSLFMEQVSVSGFAASYCSMFQTDVVSDYRDTIATLGESKMPVLLVYGDADDSITPADIEDARHRLPRHDYLLMPGAGHSPHVERLSVFNAQMLAFMEQVNASLPFSRRSDSQTDF